MDRSLLDIAHDFLMSCDKPQNMENIYAAVQNESGLSEEEFMEVKSQFYTDFTLCSNFIYCGKGDWDIKTRQPIDLYDCDSSYFLDPEEKKELQEARRRKAKREQASHEDNDSIAGYEGVEEYVERDDEDDSYDDVDSDDLLMQDDHDYDEEDEDDEYDDLMDQYEDLYEE